MIFGRITPFLNIAAFLLLLLVTLSVPIIKDIYLFKLGANSHNHGVHITGDVKFGIWGYCTSDSGRTMCSSRHLAYAIDDNVAQLLGITHLVNLTTRALTSVLVLHPIACALTFIALLLSLIMARPTSGTTRFSSLLTLIVTLLAAMLTTAAFFIDIALVIDVDHSAKKQSNNALAAPYGNAVWMVLGAMVALWVACITSVCGVVQIRRHRRDVAASGAKF